MSRKGGRPTRDQDFGGTRQIRVYADLEQMIADIAEAEDITQANLIDPLLRPQIAARFERNRSAIEKIKKAKEQIAKAQAELKRPG